MSQPTEKTEFINGPEIVVSPVEAAADELRSKNIVNFSVRELSNGSQVIEFVGDLLPETVGIMNSNGFRLR